ncbi:zinc finger protein [Cinnamomum micranthum f. kanehirae]|uniref:Zinc finger protein n=1 Tax=Cinnamomum micranthum f. kanehirae TaxID=337451 RepID=A0A3S3NN10_9MAGN|nr:zinc finger protein [Cinnamomum micranthum f. kanehirae]
MSDGTPISSVAASIRSDDPAWAYGYVDPPNNKHVICRFCKKVIKGVRITKLKEHLGGVKGDIAPCKNVPGDVKWQMERLVLEGKKDRAKERQLNEEIGNPYEIPRGDADEDDVEVEEVEPFTNPITSTTTSRKGKEKVSQISTQNKRRGVSNTSQPPMSNFFAPQTSPGSQLGIKSALATKELKDATDLAVGRFWFDANLPFNAARSNFCQPMADGIAVVGPGYKMPSYHDLCGKILGKIVPEVNAFMEHYKSCWSETRCSVMADGWTDERQRTLINFLVHCPKGVTLLKSVDASPIIKNSDTLFKIFDEIVLLVGPNNIVQFITDNDATYKAAGKRVAKKYGTFYWTACAAHCIDLMLEDMAKTHLLPVNASTIETPRKITKFIYNHSSVLNLMRREYTNRRELIRPAITRFATNFISLQCLVKCRKELRQMYPSTAWVESNASSTPLGIEIIEIILNNTFWMDVEQILKVSEALVVVLRLADSEEKPAMGYVGTTSYTGRLSITGGKIKLHSALHAVAYYLNPAFFFSPTFSKHSEVMRGLNNVIEKLVPDFDTQDMIFKQCDAYKDSRFDFGSAAAI